MSDIWIFSFGYDHTWQGESLAKRYVRVEGDYMDARLRFMDVMGRAWSMQYAEADGLAMAAKYGLTELTLEGVSA